MPSVKVVILSCLVCSLASRGSIMTPRRCRPFIGRQEGIFFDLFLVVRRCLCLA